MLRTTFFIHSSNVNAEALPPILPKAVRRKIEEFYYICLGYNNIVGTKWRLCGEKNRKYRVNFFVTKDT